MTTEKTADKPSVFTYLCVLVRVAHTTLGNWLVGLTPEENHAIKGEAWARVTAYRWAAWHFRKYLKYSEDSRARASLAWCYAQLGMVESAIEHYRLAYARNRQPEIALYLAQAELDFGNPGAARALLVEIAPRRHELSSDALCALDDLERCLASGTAGFLASAAEPRNAV